MICVLTDPRRPVHLLSTLRSLDESATDTNKIVVVDGSYSPELSSTWRAELAPKPAGARNTQNRWSTWRAFELAVAAEDDLLFFEDDVTGCPSAALYAETLRVPDDCAFLSLYAPWGDASFPPGIWRYHASKFSFCQALKVPLHTCRVLVEARDEMAASACGGSDECIGEIGGRRDWLVGVHYPGLFQHVGAFSVVSGDRTLAGNRHSRAWLADIDAMKLRRSPGEFDHYR